MLNHNGPKPIQGRKTQQRSGYRELRAAQVVYLALNTILRSGRVLNLDLINLNFYVTRVTLSKDLRIASCYVRNFDAASSREGLIKGLTRASKSIRIALTAEVSMKYSPELRFIYDLSLDNQAIVNDILEHLSNNSSKC